jgi:putative ABC transport system ATP-binding protein
MRSCQNDPNDSAKHCRRPIFEETRVAIDMLHLNNVKKAFRNPDGSQLPIIDIAEFHVAPGEQMVLAGRSGSGKTTLLHLIAGISRPDSGSVKVDTFDLTLLPEAECDRFRAGRIGYVFQTFNLLPGFSALENVLLGMRFAHGRPDAIRARRLIERVGLGHRLHHKPTMLSVGEQQRVAVARALANKPKLLLADEPTANVDTGHQQQVLELLREACDEEKVALILVTHTPEVAAQFDRIEQLEEINRASPTPVNCLS